MYSIHVNILKYIFTQKGQAPSPEHGLTPDSMLHTPRPDDLEDLDQVSENSLSYQAPVRSQGPVANQNVEKTIEQPLVAGTNSKDINHQKDLLAKNITEVNMDFQNQKQNMSTGTKKKRLADPKKESKGSRKRNKPSTEKTRSGLKGKQR